MQQMIPTGIFKLNLLIPAQYLGAFKQIDLLDIYTVSPDELFIMDDTDKPYFEVDLDDAQISEVVNSLISNKVEADIQVLPLFNDSDSGESRVNYNAFIRNIDGVFTCFINSKDEEALAYGLYEALNELNKNNIHEADEIMLNRINELHSLKVGWLV